jgi:hypothetical protein
LSNMDKSCLRIKMRMMLCIKRPYRSINPTAHTKGAGLRWNR